VGARNYARGAVLRGEVVEHPNRIAYPVAELIGDGAAIDVQRLRFSVVRIGGTRVETAQLVIGAHDVLDALEDLRYRDQIREDRTLVNQIREAAGARLRPELGPRLVAFQFPQCFHALAKVGEQRRRDEAG
jgi:hypothetical protein